MAERYPRPTRWGTYSRISSDPNDEQRGVERQRADTRAAVESRGGEVVEEYVENDTSAYRKRRIERTSDDGSRYFIYRTVRPVWQQALADLRAGVVDALMVWDLDRLARDPRDLEDAIEVVEHHGRRIEGETGGLDLSTDAGRAMARVLVAMAAKSSADTARRVARAARENAERGTPAGKRAFGWRDDKVTLDPWESGLVREAVDGLLRGATNVGSVATTWNEAGALTAHYGKPWRGSTVRQYLRNPRLAGYRTYRREILRRADGSPVTGAWEPLLTPETWEQLQDALGRPGDKERRARVPHKASRHYLLTGLLVCGVCGGPVYGNRDSGRGGFWYRCTNVRDGEGKHSVTISGVFADDVVTELARGRLTQAGEVVAEPAPFTDADRLEAAQRKVAELMAAWQADELPASIAFPQVRQLEAEVAELRAAQAAHEARQQAPAVAELAAMFDAADSTGVRRTVLEQLFDVVVIRPPSGNARGHDPSRIVPVWRNG